MLAQYPEFLADMYEAWNCDKVVHIGDLSDFHAISFHEGVGLESIETELDMARTQVSELTAVFPEVEYLTGNHMMLCPLGKQRKLVFRRPCWSR